MREYFIAPAARSAVPLLAVLLLAAGSAIADQTLSEGEIVERILSRLKTDIVGLRQMTWVETAVLEKRDREGAVRSRTVETEEIFFEGTRRLQRPLSADMGDDADSLSIVRGEESRFLQQAEARDVRSNPFDMENLMRCFRFRSEGTEIGDDGTLLKFGFRPIDDCIDDPSRAARILNNLAGTLWMDEATSEIVHMEGAIEKPVPIGFGILGRIDSFQIHIDREAVSPDVWAIVHTDYRARGRAFIFNRFDVRSTRYRSAFARAGPALAKGADETPEGASLALSGAQSVGN